VGARFNPAAYLADMIAKTPARSRSAAMVWAYFDETVTHRKVDGEADKPPQYLPDQLLVGGCVSSLEKWKAFEAEWRRALDDEGIGVFHATDFYGFKKQFEWYTPEGEKDFARHEVFRDRLADIIIEQVEEALAFTAAVSVGATEKSVFKRAYNDGALRALNAMSRRVFDGDPAYVILARHPHVPPWLLLRYFENFNWDNSLMGCGIFDPKDVIPLQAADFVCHAVNRTWNGLEAKSERRLAEGFGKRGKVFSVQLGSSWNPSPEIFGQRV
jgi:hypothetical protein